MGSLSSNVAERARRFFGLKPGDKVSDERRDELRRVAWWMVESDAAKRTAPGSKQISQVIGAALPVPQSPIEVLLVVAIAKVDSLAVHFRPQYQVGPYAFDVAFPAVKLGVECDGAEFHREPAQVLRDQRRDSFLSKLGWQVIRFMGWEIRRSPIECVARIARYHEALKAL